MKAQKMEEFEMERTNSDLEKNSVKKESVQRNKSILGSKKSSKYSPWKIFSKAVTFWAPDFVLSFCGKKTPDVRQAFREKCALCFIIVIISAIVAYVTFGLNITLCPPSSAKERITLAEGKKNPNYGWISGSVYDVNTLKSVYKTKFEPNTDYTFKFPPSDSLCRQVQSQPFFFPCAFKGNCLDRSLIQGKDINDLAFDWSDIEGSSRIVVFNGNAIDLQLYLDENNPFLGAKVDLLLRNNLGKDISFQLLKIDHNHAIANCLVDYFKVATVYKQTSGCFASNLILVISLVVILGIVLVRFIMAVAFDWFISHQLDKIKFAKMKTSTSLKPNKDGGLKIKNTRKSRLSFFQDSNGGLLESPSFNEGDNLESELYTILFITCYSENEESLQTTIESLANTDYHDQKKLLFIIADGLVKGSGNSKTTPELILDMIDISPEFADPVPMSYVAIASGSKEHNMAKVYAGDYNSRGRSVPVIVVVKCGTEDETGKPGNRGKRDSQIILMNFLQRVMFNDRMCPLDYDLFNKIYYLMGVTPDVFEVVLMVDADTKVATDSLGRMIAAMKRDPMIMGLCGETRIANKKQSWVTAIQVFEYYISHHLGKAFESVFGGVTCLPGCFCMYRIKARKNGNWVPILANPEVIQDYSLKEVETLHQKNLLLLGEDRFLSTLMLKTFPKRKMIFVPQAVCKTVVPDEFKVLLSQRRRWINSTIHNLLELILVRDLCGIFCFSMHFVIFMELIGTVVLPAAIVFTYVLIVTMILYPAVSPIPVILLGLILGLPAILILLTTRKIVYIMWMFAYLLALPVWNFILPVYAYWHFDDFSWGQTRKVDGAKGDDHGQKTGKFDSKIIPMKSWREWTGWYKESLITE